MSVVILRENGESIILEGATGLDINSEKTVPTHPIEARSDEPLEIRSSISDSARRLPTNISITGVLTQSPIERAQGPASIEEFIDLLEELNRTNELVSIQNNFELHSNMLLSSYPRRYAASQNVTYSLIFQQIETAIREIVTIPFTAPAPRAADTMGDTKKLGESGEKQTNIEKAEQLLKSAAVASIDLFFGN